MSIDKLKTLAKKYEKELFKKPNVVGVGVGYKEVAGVKTGELVVVCFVSEKIPLASLASDELIPATLDGVKTDVIKTGIIRAETSALI